MVHLDLMARDLTFGCALTTSYTQFSRTEIQIHLIFGRGCRHIHIEISKKIKDFFIESN